MFLLQLPGQASALHPTSGHGHIVHHGGREGSWDLPLDVKELRVVEQLLNHWEKPERLCHQR